MFQSSHFMLMNRPNIIMSLLFLRVSALYVCFLLPIDIQAQEAESEKSDATPIIIERASPLSISGNLELCKGTETILKAEGEFESFIWDKGGVKGRYLKVNEEGVYEVTAKTKGGCTFRTKVNVRYRPCPI